MIHNFFICPKAAPEPVVVPNAKVIEAEECDGCDTTPEKEAGEAPEIEPDLFESNQSGQGGATVPEPIVNVEPNPALDLKYLLGLSQST